MNSRPSISRCAGPRDDDRAGAGNHWDVSILEPCWCTTGSSMAWFPGHHTTAHTVRPAFEIIRTQPDVSTVSSVFLMCLSDRVLAYGDCAIVPDPGRRISWPTSRSVPRVRRRSSASIRGWPCCRIRPATPGRVPASTRYGPPPIWCGVGTRTYWWTARFNTMPPSTRRSRPPRCRVRR